MSSTDQNKMPEEFPKIMRDFITDIQTTFPEMTPLIKKWWKDKSTFEYIDNLEEKEKKYLEAQETSIQFLFKFIQKKWPPRFFDILYQNEEMFQEDSNIDTEFLPHIHFKNLWEFDISEKTRETIWKYLQLIMFSIVGSISNKEAFGDSAKLFEAINQEEFKTKLEETLEQMQNMFQNMGSSSSNSNDEESTFQMPNAENIQEHISGMLDGKLGQLAKEIAEETAADLNMDMENATDMKDVFQKMMKNPSKLMGLVKNVGDKLDSRIKSGEIKESELISEAANIMNRMKNMPGMENIESMLKNMGIPGLGKNMKVNTGAMEAQMNRNLKTAQMKERMKAKAEANRLQKEQEMKQQQSASASVKPALTDEQLFAIFNAEEKAEKTPRNAKPNSSNPTNGKAKKKKGGNK
jgi:NADP-dependent 3-hydroxy acid dehydrogenase YdfG